MRISPLFKSMFFIFSITLSLPLKAILLQGYATGEIDGLNSSYSGDIPDLGQLDGLPIAIQFTFDTNNLSPRIQTENFSHYEGFSVIDMAVEFGGFSVDVHDVGGEIDRSQEWYLISTANDTIAIRSEGRDFGDPDPATRNWNAFTIAADRAGFDIVSPLLLDNIDMSLFSTEGSIGSGRLDFSEIECNDACATTRLGIIQYDLYSFHITPVPLPSAWIVFLSALSLTFVKRLVAKF